MNIVISNVTLVDNGMGIMPLIFAPPSVSHAYADKTVRLQVSFFIFIIWKICCDKPTYSSCSCFSQNALIVGSSPNFNCSDTLPNSDYNIANSATQRAPRPLKGKAWLPDSDRTHNCDFHVSISGCAWKHVYDRFLRALKSLKCFGFYVKKIICKSSRCRNIIFIYLHDSAQVEDLESVGQRLHLHTTQLQRSRITSTITTTPSKGWWRSKVRSPFETIGVRTRLRLLWSLHASVFCPFRHHVCQLQERLLRRDELHVHHQPAQRGTCSTRCTCRAFRRLTARTTPRFSFTGRISGTCTDRFTLRKWN